MGKVGYPTLLAKALYDNTAETPDELAFRRGDVITILEQDTNGLEGWWLCSFRGKTGIAPGNRLKLITGMLMEHSASKSQDYQSPPQHPVDWNHRRSWDVTPNKVVTPQRQGDVFLYDQPRAVAQDYDVPPSRYPSNTVTRDTSHIEMNHLYNTPTSNRSSREELDQNSSLDQSMYDTPPQSQSMLLTPNNSMYDTPPSHQSPRSSDHITGSTRTNLSSKFSEDSLLSLTSRLSNVSGSRSNPSSLCDSARSSMDISPLDMYDVPPSHRDRAKPPVQSSKDSGLDMYDSPPKVTKSPPSLVDDYDVPRQKSAERDVRKLPYSEPSSPGALLEDYDVPKNSFLSLSKGKSPSPQPVSEPASPGSLLDNYDVPQNRPPHIGAIQGRTNRHKSPSVGSLLDDYDVPKNSSTDSPNRGPFRKQKSLENMYDDPDGMVSKPFSSSITTKSKDNLEHAVDDLYDVPKNNAPVKNMNAVFSELGNESKKETRGVYDIPPQVTRDSVISSKSDSSDGTNGDSQRLSTCSNDSRNSDIPIYDELPLDHDAAMDLVIKLQQDVQKSTTKLCSFISSSWRKKDHLEQRLFDIQQACRGVKDSLEEFVDFAQGTLANSAKLQDRKLINKLSKHLVPLQQAMQQIRYCFKNLDDMEWNVAKLTNPEQQKRDDLGQIASLSKDLTADVRKAASVIQGNSTLLFKRARDLQKALTKDRDSSKPPISKKPTPAAKPLSLPPKTGNVQQRPLPAPPPTERPLPPTPTEKKSHSFGTPDPKRFSGEFKRHSGEFKHWSGEFQVKRLSRESKTPERDEGDGHFKPEELQQEYDYVQLEEEEKKALEEKERKKRISPDRDRKTPDKEIKTIDEEVHKGEKELEDKVERDIIECNEKDRKQNVDAKSISERENSKHEIPEHDRTPERLSHLESCDRQVLSYYLGQMDTHNTMLINAIDTFFSCIESSQPPKVFISNSKFVVISAHKLVYIGDSLHKNLTHVEVRNKINQCANHLCECLKSTVTATKTAALQYPSIPAVQEMVDRVVSVSHAAHQLKIIITQASAL